MPKTRHQKRPRIAVTAILAFTLTTATPAFAAGPAADFSDTLTSWVRTWFAPLLDPTVDHGGPEGHVPTGPTSASSRSSDDGTPVPPTTSGGSDGPCDLVCTEAGPGGDPDG